MSITDELREWAEGNTLRAGMSLRTARDQALAIADRIDEEHEEKVSYWQGACYEDGYKEGLADNEDAMAERGWVKLPVDADGVPIRVGDVVEFGENRNQGIVKALNEHMVIAMHVDDGYTNYAKYGLLWNADACRHVKPRTLEDVLTDFAEAIEERGTEWVDVSQTANAIRELLRGDA